jgi:hypothetical protein
MTRISEDGDDAAAVLALAELFGVPLRAEHVDEVSAAWRLMQPHLDRVRGIELAPDEEPAAHFRP